MEYEEGKDLSWVKETVSKALRSKICTGAILLGLASTTKDISELNNFVDEGDIPHSISETLYIGTELSGTLTLAALSIQEHLKAKSKDALLLEEQGTELQAGQTFYPRQPESNRL